MKNLSVFCRRCGKEAGLGRFCSGGRTEVVVLPCYRCNRARLLADVTGWEVIDGGVPAPPPAKETP